MNPAERTAEQAKPAAPSGPARTLPPEPPRVLVDLASYSYAPEGGAPFFTLEATSFEVRSRELVAILGRNGSGKSTLLRLLAGTLAPLSGRVKLEGLEVSRLDLRTRAQRIAMVQQETPLLFPVRVWEFVMQGRYPYSRGLRFETEEDAAVARQALVEAGADPLRGRWMHKLSGGEKQRAVLARALAQQPLLLLLDEPTLHLDIAAQVDLLRRLRRIATDRGHAVVVVTHELNLAAEFADRIVLLDRGKTLRVGKPAEVYQQELLQQVFGTLLYVEYTARGTPKVTFSGADTD
ncbi:MAG TPA: ATP-binding cassette domain-containing protein [Candidatus Acidoferrales bacterium]|nr:ATP-binding cassette domain-containing protein [Candidatus Acidoferrales bacterium]